MSDGYLLGSGIVMGLPKVFATVGTRLTGLMYQPATAGAWPTLRAAAARAEVLPRRDAGVGRGESRGPATRVGSSGAAHDEDDARWLWQESERLTGVVYDLPVRAA